ncbi:MAG: hypothetical protein U0667_08920 [Chloroflexota bacterium]
MGGVFAFAVAQLFPVTATDIVGGLAVSGASAGGTPFPFVRGVVAPIVAVLLTTPPAVLLPYKRFNDVLDGATFGVASGSRSSGRRRSSPRPTCSRAASIRSARWCPG